jgi:hypothetical protein
VRGGFFFRRAVQLAVEVRVADAVLGVESFFP